MFAVLSLSEGEGLYEDACVSAVSRLEICDPKTGLDRPNHLRGIASAENVLNIAGCKLEWGEEPLPRNTTGRFVASVGGCCFAMCIETASECSSVGDRTRTSLR